jgi:DNA repair exonuclease SbcCD ATPase subunit
MDSVILSFLSFLTKHIPTDIMILAIAGSLFMITKFYIIPMAAQIKKLVSNIENIIKNVDTIDQRCNINAKYIEEIQKFVKLNDEIKDFLQDMENRNKIVKLENKNTLEQIKTKIEELSKRIDNLIDKYERNQDNYNNDKADINKELYSIKNEIHELKNKIEPIFYTINGLRK